MTFEVFEKSHRDDSYSANLRKEARITDIYCKWCKEHGKQFRINPTDTEMNRKGSDITVYGEGGRKSEIDLKGCQNKYANVCLSYERSYDSIHWFSTLDGKITTSYVFIDELDNIYSISMYELKLLFDTFKKTEVSPKTGGHWQRCILIPKTMLHKLS